MELAHVIQAAKLKELREMTPLAMAGSLGDQLMHYMHRAEREQHRRRVSKQLATRRRLVDKG